MLKSAPRAISTLGAANCEPRRLNDQEKPRPQTIEPHLRTMVSSPKKSGDMEMAEPNNTQSSMTRLILFATIVSGVAAAYLMYRRGESLGMIAKQAITNPVGSLVAEVKNKV
jgi:hypothetical protein